jgi:hypothetical protein
MRVETTGIYFHADMSIKERALARWTPKLAATGPPTLSSPSSRICDHVTLAGCVAVHEPVLFGYCSIIPGET